MDLSANDNSPRPPRQVDRTNRHARTAVADVVARCAPMRARIAVMHALAQRRLTATERARLTNECAEFQHEIAAARTALIIGLMDAPAKVTSHSRVFDIEKALDGIEVALAELQGRLDG